MVPARGRTGLGTGAGVLASGSVRLSVFAVVFRVRLGGFSGVVRCVVKVTLCEVSVMRGSFVLSRFMMRSGVTMVPGGVLVVFCCFVMVLCGLFGHGFSLDLANGGKTLPLDD
jgi:hypothetical protein